MNEPPGAKVPPENQTRLLHIWDTENGSKSLCGERAPMMLVRLDALTDTLRADCCTLCLLVAASRPEENLE